MARYIVWNWNKTASFETDDYQLAYEVRKGAETNCYTSDGTFVADAYNFCREHGHMDCTLEINQICQNCKYYDATDIGVTMTNIVHYCDVRLPPFMNAIFTHHPEERQVDADDTCAFYQDARQ